MAKTVDAEIADVVSYNTLLKAHLLKGNFQRAKLVVEDMKKADIKPNRVTFNELLNAVVRSKNPEHQRHSGFDMQTPPGLAKGDDQKGWQIWELVDEMKASGVKPNHVTCSILLKGLNKQSSQSDVLSTMELLNSMEEPMDEVLLSSVVEACVRIGKLDLLTAKLKQVQGNDSISVNGAHTFGSLIKAYGHAKDINGVWRCWKEMRSRHIRPTCI